MHRYFVTGTDTDVGKTRVTAALALALKNHGVTPTIVKLVQTGLPPGMPGDSARAGKLAGVRSVELARFEKAADPWSAALAYGLPEVHARELVDAIVHIENGVVAEGAGGLMVPLNAREQMGNVAVLGGFDTILVIGLKLGCVNHALLTITQCQQAHIRLAGAVLVERWGPTEGSYRDDVARTLQGKVEILGILPFDEDEANSVKTGSQIFGSLFN
ncbi:MAG TPA: dethiobiotin synthase [Candidatus Baltobacteraceae bacterium]|nr:dethiobiotin synthase [Candidatus Baltobacteraceae bacterium]